MQEKKITITYVEDVPLTTSDDTSWIAGPNRYQSHPPVKRRRKLSPRTFITLALMLLALGTGALIYTISSRDTNAAEEDPVPVSNGETSTPSDSSASGQTDSSAEETTTLSEDGSEESAETVLNETDPYAPPKNYDYSSPVPESAPQGESWFTDSVFVGNSQTQGLLLYTGIPAASCADVGLTVETAKSLAEFDDPENPGGEEKLTALDYLQKADYKKVYLLFGINELGWVNEDAFINQYADLIEAIQTSHPDAQIYVQSILPVGQKATQEKSYLTNERIGEFNGRLQNMAADQKVYYLDVASTFPTPLSEELSNDGVHLVKSGCETWRDYILSHCIYQSDGETSLSSAPSESLPPVSVTEAPTLPKKEG